MQCLISNSPVRADAVDPRLQWRNPEYLFSVFCMGTVRSLGDAMHRG